MRKGNSEHSNKNKFILDSFAVVAFFQDEKGAEIVEDLFEKAKRGEVKLFLPMVNLGEVMHTFIQDYGEKETIKLIKNIKNLPITITPIDETLVWEAAKIKAQGGISYADSFVIAAALVHKASIVTGDREFKKFERTVKIEWLLTKSK